MIGEKVRAVAIICDDKVIDLIASGYNENILPYAWLALITRLANVGFDIEEPEPIYHVSGEDMSFSRTEQMVKEIGDKLKY